MRGLVLALMMVGGFAGAVQGQAVSDAPAGNYTLDLGHARLLFRASHLGFSNYTALFTKFEAQLVFDPVAPEAMKVAVQVDPTSVETHYPDPSIDFNAVIEGPEFLDAAAYPVMQFVSTGVVVTGADTADVTGDLTLHGVTKPMVLAVRFNGGYAGHPMDPGGARIGFSATGVLLRSEFGMGFGIPAPGTTLGVSDRVEVIVEAEFLNPDAAKP
ncbi:MAG: YceI family protein [Paracoccaceae bacterium]